MTPGSEQVSIRRQVRILLLLEAARKAGLEPLPVLRLHVLAYLSDVLSPVWDLAPFDGRVLKRDGGPFYPELQRDLDRLVGRGMVTITHVGHVQIGRDRLRIDGHYAVNPGLAQPVLELLPTWPEEARLAMFLRELLLAASSLADDEIDDAFHQDATYSNGRIGQGNVIEFAEWTQSNYSATAAQKLGTLASTSAMVGSGEKLHLYIRHLRARLHGGR